MAKKKTAKKKASPKKPTANVYQFKITLLDAKPTIWRRIQLENCTLDKFHEHIQTAMGWTNSHLYQFDIQGKPYGDLGHLDDGLEDLECADTTRTLLSEILPKTGQRLAFKYEYDFGDSWGHEVLFEGSPSLDPKAQYPVCLEGERACPPEGCSGIGGDANFLESIRNPEHEEHKDMLEWIGGSFDPEEFDAATATISMTQEVVAVVRVSRHERYTQRFCQRHNSVH